MADDLRVFTLPGAGLICKALGCGGVLPTVARTIESPGFVNRERRCPKCGMLNITDERVIHTRSVRKYMSQPME